MATMDVGRALLANAEFAKGMEQLFAELGRSNAISPEAAAAIAGIATSWAAV